MYARYTEYLRDIMKNEVTAAALQKALSTYPLYEPETLVDLIPDRDALNTKLLNHFKYREIGFETLGRFLDELEITMNEIMPRYNELYKTVDIMANLDNPFDNVDVTETYQEERSGTSSSDGNTSSSSSSTGVQTGTTTGKSEASINGKGVESDTPQNSLSIGSKDIDSVDYASNANWSESISSDSSEGSSETSSTSESSESGSSYVSGQSSETISHTFHKIGNQGVTTYARDMNEYRTSIIDVTDQIINDERLQELFMLIY